MSQGTLFGPGKPMLGGYAGMCGAGPDGETCGTCAAFRIAKHHGRRYFKCGRILATHGAGTDIRKSAPACEHWEVKR